MVLISEYIVFASIISVSTINILDLIITISTIHITIIWIIMTLIKRHSVKSVNQFKIITESNEPFIPRMYYLSSIFTFPSCHLAYVGASLWNHDYERRHIWFQPHPVIDLCVKMSTISICSSSNWSMRRWDDKHAKINAMMVLFISFITRLALKVHQNMVIHATFYWW